MGLGIVNDIEFEKELTRSVSKEVVGKVVDNPEKGRGKDNNEVPDSLRQIIGEESVINGRESALALADVFGVSKSSVSAYANGSTSTKSYDKQPGLDKLNQSRLRVSTKARNRLHLALNSLTKEKLEDTKAVDLAVVARSMSAIVKDMEPELPRSVDGNNGTGPTYIFYAPIIRDEKHYDIVNARE